MGSFYAGKYKMRPGLVWFCIMLFVSFIPLQIYVGAGEIQDAQNKKEEVDQQINDIKYMEKRERESLDWNKKKKDEIVKALEQRGLKKEEIEKQVELLKSAIISLEDNIEQAEQDYGEQRELLKKRLRTMYKKSRSTYFIEELISCKDFNQLYTRIKMMTLLADADQRLADRIHRTQKEIEELKEQKEAEVENTLLLAENNSQEIDQLLISRANVEASIDKSQDKIWEYEQQQDELLEISNDFKNLISSLKLGNGTYVGGDMSWPLPVSKHISSYYGMRMHPIFKVWKMHTGVDISADYNNYIVAANSGTVIYADWRSGYGNTVIIDHGGGITTLYAHINSGGFLVRLGQKVEPGQSIAKVGSTGYSTGPHLHFEVRVNGETQSPLDYITIPE